MFLGCVYSVRSLLTTLFGHPADRDGDINQLRSEVHEVLGNRNVSDEKFQAVVLDEIASLKVGTCSVVQHTCRQGVAKATCVLYGSVSC